MAWGCWSPDSGVADIAVCLGRFMYVSLRFLESQRGTSIVPTVQISSLAGVVVGTLVASSCVNIGSVPQPFCTSLDPASTQTQSEEEATLHAQTLLPREVLPRTGCSKRHWGLKRLARFLQSRLRSPGLVSKTGKFISLRRKRTPMESDKLQCWTAQQA